MKQKGEAKSGRPKTLQIEETAKFEKVREFLNGKAIKSQQTKKSYLIALSQFQTFLSKGEYNIETILVPLTEKSIDVYSLLNNFRDFLLSRVPKLSPATIRFYFAGLRSYLETYDIEIRKFKRKVPLPDLYRGNVEAIDDDDIRIMLEACDNTRLKAFILVLASSGMRALETCRLRNRDIEFGSPSKIHLRAETTKTKQGNDIYISNEAAKKVQAFIESKYKTDYNTAVKNYPNDLLFGKEREVQPINIYKVLQENFAALLEKIGMNKRRDGDVRREISFHSFRRFVKTTISNLGYGDYSEWLLGHKSTMAARYYYTKEQERREIYLKCMKQLTFLDTSSIKIKSKEIESRLEESTKEMEDLKRISKDKTKELEEMKGIVRALEEETDYSHESIKSLQGELMMMVNKNSDTMKKLQKMETMWLKAMAGHVVRESDFKDGTYEVRSKRKETK